MWRSAESRVRESSEGGRIGPDLDLARLLYPPPREAKAHSLAAEARHAALDPLPASRNPRPLRAALALARPGEEDRDFSPEFSRLPPCPLRVFLPRSWTTVVGGAMFMTRWAGPLLAWCAQEPSSASPKKGPAGTRTTQRRRRTRLLHSLRPHRSPPTNPHRRGGTLEYCCL
jgi:hypothetical protein